MASMIGDWLSSRVAVKAIEAKGWRWYRWFVLAFLQSFGIFCLFLFHQNHLPLFRSSGFPSVVVTYIDLADVVSKGEQFIEVGNPRDNYYSLQGSTFVIL